MYIYIYIYICLMCVYIYIYILLPEALELDVNLPRADRRGLLALLRVL